MPQTMLALLAMLVVMMLTVSQYQNAVHVRKNIVRNEVSMQTTGVAVDWLERIGSEAFDEAVADGSVITSPNQLTEGPPFAADFQENDIDDFHGVSKDTMRVVNGREIWFHLQSSIAYADPEDPEKVVAWRTKAKKATVRAWSTSIANPDTVVLSQTFTCGTRCDWI
jgi:hypothetical protein